MEISKLTSHQKARLRGMGQTLEASLSVGKGGITPSVVLELERLLNTHELVKIRLLAERDDRPALMESVAAKSNSEVVGSVGKTVLLFRRNPDTALQKISLPPAASE